MIRKMLAMLMTGTMLFVVTGSALASEPGLELRVSERIAVTPTPAAPAPVLEMPKVTVKMRPAIIDPVHGNLDDRSVR